MIGGKVIEVRAINRHGQNLCLLWCIDGFDELAVYTAPSDDLPKVGDTIWWQGRDIYWSDENKKFSDRKIPRIGYSFDPRNLHSQKEE